jgi:hypothetical protein
MLLRKPVDVSPPLIDLTGVDAPLSSSPTSASGSLAKIATMDTDAVIQARATASVMTAAAAAATVVVASVPGAAAAVGVAVGPSVDVAQAAPVKARSGTAKRRWDE